ncbi:hypothetical protein ALC56_10966 [Trachymyrmex septentrionalis]|uniref:Uncharacterized protein n=1 Tax=Trachymyrmex septentrionalis TaxID=34720 RepID=A0A195F317_9HYME|nr:hypothetical protein ALC56_10966 [Trachymyrmex septentrionalis]
MNVQGNFFQSCNVSILLRQDSHIITKHFEAARILGAETDIDTRRCHDECNINSGKLRRAVCKHTTDRNRALILIARPKCIWLHYVEIPARMRV